MKSMESDVNLTNQYTVLAVDDAKDSLMLLEFDLTDAGYKVVTAESGEQALKALKQFDIQLIVLDMHMPGQSGLMILKRLKSEYGTRQIPVIMLSASDDENTIVSSLELGADDYVTKPYIPKVLLARMSNALRFMERTKQLEMAAKTDYLTKLLNRGGFQKESSRAISQANRAQSAISFAMFDIDHFKKLNDQYGHEAGDIALQEFASLLADNFRDYDIIGRIGGEEFAVCMPDTAIEQAFIACERFRTALSSKIITPNNSSDLTEIVITVSIGVTASPSANFNLDELIRKADAMLYQAKEQGRNQTVVDQEVNTATENTLDANLLIKDLNMQADAPVNEEFSFPGIDTKTGLNNVLGDEALFKEILDMFVQDHGEDVNKIKTAIESEDHSSTKALVHTLKGVACSIGALDLFESCKTLDHAINENNYGRYKELFSPIEVELDKVLKGIAEGG